MVGGRGSLWDPKVELGEGSRDLQWSDLTIREGDDGGAPRARPELVHIAVRSLPYWDFSRCFHDHTHPVPTHSPTYPLNARYFVSRPRDLTMPPAIPPLKKVGLETMYLEKTSAKVPTLETVASVSKQNPG